jgi:penicillin-binding protein 1C
MIRMSTASVRKDRSLFRKRLKYALAALAIGAAGFILATALSLKPITKNFDSITADSRNVPVTDRFGNPLSITYQAQWNNRDARPLYAMPELLVAAFLFSEDRKFYDHGGVDWKARGSALVQNIRRGATVRGASTITEQVVRLINPRPRTLWSKWLEGIEATLLERHASKPAILEFYLNQIPYAANRRGVVQAARYYFNRDLETLSARETLALAVLARAPSAYDLYRNPRKIDAPLGRLAAQMKENGKLGAACFADLQNESLDPAKPSLATDARHFARFVQMNGERAQLHTTLDSGLQRQVQDILDSRIRKLSARHVMNAAAIVIDHTNGEILAWVVAGARDHDTKAGEIDPVISPRQPGSTLKPFLYAGALEKGWTAATILNDAPVAEAVGSGLHRFRNYSNAYYGPVTLREALGNSLNIPAVLAINYVGVDRFLDTLHRLGFASLDRGAAVYDEGLALGNGEVTLLELARAYSALANRGQIRPLKFLMDDYTAPRGDAVYTPETASIIGNIISDPRARALEFGNDSVLNLPVRTAAKTGTSTDYRDAWTLAYNDRYTVGIWMGNLDRTPMKEVTGSTGPALAMRSIFQILNRNRDTQTLYLAPTLIEADICTRPADEDGKCPERTELFARAEKAAAPPVQKTPRLELVRPTPGLMMAYDPRVPASHQKFRFELAGLSDGDEVEWILNGESLARSKDARYLWPMAQGKQKLAVVVHAQDGGERTLAPVEFLVR